MLRLTKGVGGMVAKLLSMRKFRTVQTCSQVRRVANLDVEEHVNNIIAE